MIHAKRKNSQKGFTLVEVIVVAVIVAALAGVAVPVYIGYVNSSRLNAATNAAGAVASFLGSCRNSGGVTAFTQGSPPVAGPAVMSCNVPGVLAVDDPTINIPDQITITHAAAANNVTGTHGGGGGASQPYSY